VSPPRLAIIGCGARGAQTYGAWLLAHPEAGSVVAVADPDPDRRRRVGDAHGVPPDRRFRDAAALLLEPRLADACVIATPDRDHVDPAVQALERGYHLLLEKPVATDEAGLQRLTEASTTARDEYGATVTVCHVLRYTPFFRTIHRVLREGRLGRLRHVLHQEQIGHWHFAHSFVRGNWRRTADSAPMILAKACHDLDILVWLAGAEPERVRSLGERSWFTAANRPEGAPGRCTDGCPVEETCAYSAPRIYLERFQAAPHWPCTVLTPEVTPESVRAALEDGPYGRCVYACDNDVADQQAVLLAFPGGLQATLTVSAFTEENTRRVELQGTEGLVRGVLDEGSLELTDFRTGQSEAIPVEAAGPGAHGGGDHALMEDFTARLARLRDGESVPEASTALEMSLASHRLAFAAEAARRATGCSGASR
jgi:predicted dehydrogenase